MDVLFLAHRAPWPPDKGDRLRGWRHLQALARLGPVDLVAPADDEGSAQIAREGLAKVCREVVVVPRQRSRAWLGAAGALVSGQPLTLGYLADARVDSALRELVSRRRHELVWGFSSGTAPWWRSVPARHRIMDLCDLDALKWESLARRGGWTAPLHALEARRLLPLELALAAEADLVLLITRGEAADLLARGGRPRRLEVLTNGTPWQKLSDLPPAAEAGPVLGFLGQMDYPPNVRAAQTLALAVLPAVRRRVPAARLMLIGRAPTAAVRRLARCEGVEVTGEVADVGAHLGRLAVFCAPLDEGRGLANKLLEAMAAGRPVVTSPLGATGLSGTPGTHYLVTDGSEATAQSVADLLEDSPRRRALGEAGRCWVAEHHDWDAVLLRLEQLVRETTGA